MRTLYIATALLTACAAGCSKKQPDAPSARPASSAAQSAAAPTPAQSPPAETSPPAVPVTADAPAATSAPSSGAHIWTALDGRKLEAELIARTTDSVTVRRASDRKEFTIRLAGLSAEDRDYANNSPIPLTTVKTFDTQKLASLKNSLPPLRPDAPLTADNPMLKDIAVRYQRSVAAIGTSGYARHVEMLKDQMAADIKRLEPVAATQLKNPPIYINGIWTTGGGAWQDVWAARSTLAWLNGPLASYVRNLEELK